LLLTPFQNFSAADIVPNLYAIAATAVVPSVLSKTQGALHQYGLFGDLAHVGGVGAVFAAFVYVYHHQLKILSVLTIPQSRYGACISPGLLQAVPQQLVTGSFGFCESGKDICIIVPNRPFS
jgi:hypothetical protein